MKPLTRIILTTILLLFTVNCSLLTLNAAVPHLINYQGRLTDKEGKPLEGAYNLTFRIYDSETAGTLLWEEDQSVTIQKGIFSVLLGGVTALNLAFDKPYFLEIKVGNEVMSPRQRITSVGYAIRAEKAEDANTVSNVGISITPAANKILPLDNNAKLPQSAVALKVYDSGWFAVSANSSYTQTHNLGTTRVLWFVFFNDSASDSGMMSCTGNWAVANTGTVGYQFQAITTTTLSVRTGTFLVSEVFENGAWYDRTSGYYRLIGLALE